MNEIRFLFLRSQKNEYDFISMPWMIGLVIMFNIKIYNLEDHLGRSQSIKVNSKS